MAGIGLNLFDPAFLSGAPVVPGEVEANEWADRCEANGAARPSSGTISAMQVFYDALGTAGISTKFKALNCIVPDNLISACTPLIVGDGVDPWTNTGFIDADILVSGLNVNGGTQHLDTGVNPSISFPGYDSGLSFFTTNETVCGMGAANSAETAELALRSAWYGVWVWCYGDIASDYMAPSRGAHTTGYHSGNVLSQTSQKMYFAKTGTAHAEVGTSSASIVGGRPNGTVWTHCAHNITTDATLWTGGYPRLSFASLHTSLTLAQSNDLFVAVQALRTSLGGGTV
jgi:hypothetical protein